MPPSSKTAGYLLKVLLRLLLASHARKPDKNIVRQILSYFVRNYRTADTFEGIARWRLLQERVWHSVRQTEVALRWLVEEGFIEELSSSGSGSPVFQLNPYRLRDAKRFLAKG